MVSMSPIHKAMFGFHTKSHFLIFFFHFNTSFHFHFNFISFHLHFFTYTSHLGPLGLNLTYLIGFCKIFKLHIFFVLII